jgi:hypothetical protein
MILNIVRSHLSQFLELIIALVFLLCLDVHHDEQRTEEQESDVFARVSGGVV